MIEIERKFHAVGHGAFYTEKIKVNDKETYNIVYDCGTSGTTDSINAIIAKEFPDGTVIDCLIISHFHRDHINGVPFLHERCRIKKVIIPLLDNAAKTLAVVEDLDMDFDYETVLEGIIYEPRTFFGERAQVLEIRPDGRQTGGDANSGTDVSMIDMWHFQPYNYQLENRLNQFKVALGSLSIDHIKTIEEVRMHWDVIINAYETIRGNPNNNSMILLSYPSNEKVTVETIIDGRSYGYVKAGCLYMGDISMGAVRLRRNVLTRLDTYKKLIGTIQIPHHGAKDNFHEKILELGFEIAVCSCKKDDPKHPSPEIITTMKSKGVKTFIVTEEPKDMVVQLSNEKARRRVPRIVMIYNTF